MTETDGDVQKRVWNRGQEATFAELKDTLFDIIQGKHPWTRYSKIRAYHPCIVEPPRHTDPYGIIIQATFGGTGSEHIMSLRGYTADHRFRDLALPLIILRGPLATSGMTGGTPTPPWTAETMHQERGRVCKICKKIPRTRKHVCPAYDQGATKAKAPRKQESLSAARSIRTRGKTPSRGSSSP